MSSVSSSICLEISDFISQISWVLTLSNSILYFFLPFSTILLEDNFGTTMDQQLFISSPGYLGHIQSENDESITMTHWSGAKLKLSELISGSDGTAQV